MAQNFIFTMQDLRKVKGGKEILKGIYLSFFPGAKIGVIGPNGAGKSTLLRIMAGVDTEFFGVAKPDPGAQGGLPAAGAAARHLAGREGERGAGPEADPRRCWTASTRCPRSSPSR